MEVTLNIADSLPVDHETVSADHLVIFQHGLEGSTENWEEFIEKLKLKYGDDVYVVCSQSIFSFSCAAADALTFE